MKLHQNNNNDFDHGHMHEQIEQMMDFVEDNQVCAVILGDVIIQPGRMNVRGTSAVVSNLTDDTDEKLTAVSLAGVLSDAMRRSDIVAEAVLHAAKFFIEAHQSPAGPICPN